MATKKTPSKTKAAPKKAAPKKAASVAIPTPLNGAIADPLDEGKEEAPVQPGAAPAQPAELVTPTPPCYYASVLTTMVNDLTASSLNYIKLDGVSMHDESFKDWLCQKLGVRYVADVKLTAASELLCFMAMHGEHPKAERVMVTVRQIEGGDMPKRIELEIGMSYRDGDDVWTVASKPVGNYVWVQSGEYSQQKHVRAVESRLMKSPVKTKVRMVPAVAAGATPSLVVSEKKKVPAHIRRGGDVNDAATLAVKACETLTDAWKLAAKLKVPNWEAMKANYEGKGTNPGMQRMWITARLRALKLV